MTDNQYLLYCKDENEGKNPHPHIMENGDKLDGPLHFWKDSEGKFNYVSFAELEAKISTLPDVCYVTYAPIPEIEKKEFPSLSEFKLRAPTEEEKSDPVIYYCKSIVGGASPVCAYDFAAF